jgi:hypothetical protein
MHRREFLGTSVSALALGVGSASAGQSASAAFGPLGSVDIPGATDAVAQDDFAYVAVGDGFAVVDISTPSNPFVVAERRDIETGTADPFEGVLDLWVSGDRLLVGGPGVYDPELAHGFGVFDISDPSTPEQIAFQPLDTPLSGGYYIHNLYLEDGIAYLTGSAAPRNPLVMYDVTLTQPREIGRWSLEDMDPEYANASPASRSLHDVTVRDGIAYIPCWDAGTWIVDVTDPTAPTVLANISEYDSTGLTGWSDGKAIAESIVPPGNAHYTMVDDAGEILGVGQEAWAVERDGELSGGPGGIDLYDVSTPSDPQHLSRIDAPGGPDQTRGGPFTSAHNFDFAGAVLYTSWYYGGVRVHNISDPSNPEELASWQNPDETSFWTADAAGDKFVATSANVGTILRENPPTAREALYVFPGLTDGDPPEAERGGDADAGGPGFGVGVAAAGLGGATLWRRMRDRTADGED